jgi:hypothetical protein
MQIQLTEAEKLVLEYRTFEYRGMQIAVNQFITGNYDYNDEHYKRLVDTYLKKYTLQQKCLLEIMAAHGYKNIAVRNFEFYMSDNTLEVVT